VQKFDKTGRVISNQYKFVKRRLVCVTFPCVVHMVGVLTP